MLNKVRKSGRITNEKVALAIICKRQERGELLDLAEVYAVEDVGSDKDANPLFNVIVMEKLEAYGGNEKYQGLSPHAAKRIRDGMFANADDLAGVINGELLGKEEFIHAERIVQGDAKPDNMGGKKKVNF